MSMTRRTWLGLVAAAAGIAALPVTASAQDAVYLGYQLPLTGNTAQYGQDFKTAAEIALKDFNASGKLSVPVEIIFEDSRSDAKEGIAIARKFVDDDRIVAVLGDFTSTVSMAAAQVYKKAGMAQLSQTASHPDYAKISEWQFRNITTQAQEGVFNADWMNDKGYKKIAVIAEQTDWGQSVVKDFAEKVEANGGEVVFTEFFNRGLPDFRSLITKIERAEPDAIYTGFFYEDGAQFMKQMQQLGVDIPVHSTSAAYNQKLVELAGPAAEGLFLTATFLPNSDAENVKIFVEEWKAARDGAEPGQFPAQAYDAVNIMLEAVAAAGPDATRESVRDALAATKDFPGVTGVTSFDENGEALKQLTKATVKDGTFVPVE
ncbi:MAG: amino acid ABC transporter substrate-binding protein [Stappia sp.]|uniref:ABC transporter substrate-binding protein n=1 Tax=Stappia sp. TaxID=1870903 RepID=UPI000C4ABCBB|nr:ABC transporter substrate-binding protein [Stappia sp.]MAA97246.1 amino acid ABC transporter substrate-binding protein [Stappia sp.]MBM19070.1 amino acid ABC transporter substrate-binding protein [Stappia sp.]